MFLLIFFIKNEMLGTDQMISSDDKGSIQNSCLDVIDNGKMLPANN